MSIKVVGIDIVQRYVRNFTAIHSFEAKIKLNKGFNYAVTEREQVWASSAFIKAIFNIDTIYG